MKGKLILLVTAAIVIGLTIAIYNMAVDQWTSNLQIAAVVVCLSELAIFCTMGLLPEMNFKNGSTGIMIDIYAALMILWSLFGANIDGNAYTIGLLVISAIMLVLIGLSVMGSHESDRLNDEVERTIDRKRSFATGRPATYRPHVAPGCPAAPQAQNLTSMWLTMQSSIEDFDTRKRVKTLVERIQAMPASTFPNPVIEGGMKELTAMSRGLANTPDPDRMLTRINNKAKELTNYIKTL